MNLDKYAQEINELNKVDEFKVECDFELIKAETNMAKGEFSGLAAAFGNEDQGGDIITRGAFLKTLADFAKRDEMPGMFFNHDTFSTQVGEWVSMVETAQGLMAKGVLWVEGNPLGRTPNPVSEQIRNAFMSKGPKGLSIGGNIDRSDPNNVEFKEVGPKGSKRLVRILKMIELRETSPVSFPMNKKAKIKMIKSDQITIRQAENSLRELGFSSQEAKSILSKGWDATLKRDVDESIERDADAAFSKGQHVTKLDTILNSMKGN